MYQLFLILMVTFLFPNVFVKIDDVCPPVGCCDQIFLEDDCIEGCLWDSSGDGSCVVASDEVDQNGYVSRDIYISFSSDKKIIGFEFIITHESTLDIEFPTQNLEWSFSTGEHHLSYFPNPCDNYDEFGEEENCINDPFCEWQSSGVCADNSNNTFEAYSSEFTVFGNENGKVLALTLNYEDFNEYYSINETCDGDCEQCEEIDDETECIGVASCEWDAGTQDCFGVDFKRLIRVPVKIHADGYGLIVIDTDVMPKFIDGDPASVPVAVNTSVGNGYNVEPGSLAMNIASLPTEFNLGKAYPNPFNPKTNISYSLPSFEYVKIIIYDLNGRVVKKLVDTARPAGKYNVLWDGHGLDGKSVATGAYIYQMTAGNFIKSEKLILIK